MQKVICELCGQEISKSNYSKHIRRHNNHPETFNKISYKLNHEDLICQFCGKECKNRNSLCNHERLCKENPNRQNVIIDGFNNKGRTAWNKGLTKETDERLQKQSTSLHLSIQSGKVKYRYSTDNPSTRESVKEKLRQTAINNLITGKVIPISHSRSKHGTYKGIHCDSLWELSYLIYCLDKNIRIERNTKYFEYMFEGRKHLYYPDFYHPDLDLYVEVKGYKDKKYYAKMKFAPNNLLVVDNQKINEYIEYVKSTYGDNIECLYDK